MVEKQVGEVNDVEGTRLYRGRTDLRPSFAPPPTPSLLDQRYFQAVFCSVSGCRRRVEALKQAQRPFRIPFYEYLAS